MTMDMKNIHIQKHLKVGDVLVVKSRNFDGYIEINKEINAWKTNRDIYKKNFNKIKIVDVIVFILRKSCFELISFIKYLY